MSNLSGHGNNSGLMCPNLVVSHSGMVAYAVAYAILMFTAFLGNMLVVFVIYHNKNMQTTVNYFIVNMSLSDFIIPLVVIPFKLRVVTTGLRSWTVDGELGVFLCKFFYFVSDITPPVSILSLVFMTIDRFYAVVFPMKAALIPKGYRVVLVVVTWVVSMLFFAPYFYGFGLRQFGTEWYCMQTWTASSSRIFSTTVCIVFIIIPFALLTGLYSVILVTLRRSKGAGEQLELQKQRRAKTNMMVIKLALSVVLAFALCWGPYNAIIFINIFLWKYQIPRELICVWPTVQEVAQFLAYSNAAINPLVYFILNQNYRRGLKRAIKKTVYGQSSHGLAETDNERLRLQEKNKI